VFTSQEDCRSQFDFAAIEYIHIDMSLRRKFEIYVAQEKQFPDGFLFVAYWHTENPRNSLIGPFFY
jgi:hypothetical protein